MKVILHNAISLDGKNSCFDYDIDTYYELVDSFSEDLTLWSSNAILRARMEEDSKDSLTVPDKLQNDVIKAVAVLDSRGKVNCWQAIIDLGYWNVFYCLVSETTPEYYISKLEEAGVQVIVCGQDKVDLANTINSLEADFGHRICRLDCGGTLNSLMLDLDLVDEVSLMVCPIISDGMGDSFAHTEKIQKFKLKEGRPLGNGVVWLRYEK